MLKNVIKFQIKGEFAFFKNKINIRENYSYHSIHKPAILGILGAILGMDGFSDFKKNKTIQYIDELSDKIKVSIIKKMDTLFVKSKINDSTMLQITSDREKVIQQTEYFLDNPLFEIYLDISDNELFDNIYDKLFDNNFVFEPVLGKSYLHCSISNVEKIEILSSFENIDKDRLVQDKRLKSVYIESLFPSSFIFKDLKVKEVYSDNNLTMGESFRLPVCSSSKSGVYIENNEFSYKNFVSIKNINTEENFKFLSNNKVLYFV